MAHDARRRLRDIHGLVTDALQVSVDARNRQQESQVGGHGLLKGQQTEHAVVNFNLNLIDSVFFNQNRLGEVFFTIQHCVDGLMDGSLGEATHPQQSLLQFFEISFKMSFHVCPDPSLKKTATPCELSALPEAASNVRLCTRISGRRE